MNMYGAYIPKHGKVSMPAPKPCYPKCASLPYTTGLNKNGRCYTKLSWRDRVIVYHSGSIFDWMETEHPALTQVLIGASFGALIGILIAGIFLV